MDYKLRRRRKERGWSLAELAMVITIGVILMAAAMWAYQSTNVSRQTSTATNDLGVLQNAVRTLYGSAPDYSNLSVPDMIAAKVIPRRMVSGNTLRNAFNGTVDIQSQNINGVTDAGFSVEFDSVPGEACVRLGVLDLGSGMTEIVINGNDFDENDFPLDLSDVITPCGDTTATMTWTFR